MLRYPSKILFGCSPRNLVKIGNILSSKRDKSLLGLGLGLQLEFLLTVPLCQSLMSSYKLNKMFSISKLVSLLLKCSLLRLQLYLRFIFSLSMNPVFSYYMFLSRFYSLWFHRHLNYLSGAQFQKSSRYQRYYYLFYIDETILVCYPQSFHNLFQTFKSLAPQCINS